MGNIFDTCKGKKNVIYNRSLFEPLQNNDGYSSINLYNNLDFIEFMTLALSCSVPPEGVWPLPGIRNRVWVAGQPCYFDIIRSNGEFEHYLPEKSIGTFKYKRGDSYDRPM